ncbi:MAG: translation initiation factor IF-2 N-terminal domain-containing protein [Phycisphaerae bacterium]
MKVKALARELGVTSRAVIERCRAEGFPVQNSISRLDAALVEALRRWFGRGSGTGGVGSGVPPADSTGATG